MKLGRELGDLLRLIPLKMPDRAPRHIDAAGAKRLCLLRQFLGAILSKHGHAGLCGQQCMGYRKCFRNRNQANVRGVPAGGVGGIGDPFGDRLVICAKLINCRGGAIRWHACQV